MIVNWPASIIALILAFIYGLIATLSPGTILGLMVNWTTTTSKRYKVTPRPYAQRHIAAIQKEPNEYMKKNTAVTFIIRTTGVFCLLIAALIVIFMINTLSLNTPG